MKYVQRVAAAALAAGLAGPAFATTVALPGDASWQSFNVNDLDAVSHGLEWIDNNNTLDPNFGTSLTFTFTIGAGLQGTLTVVDAGFAGDTFVVRNGGAFLGNTSGVPTTNFLTAANVGTDFNVALADPNDFSQGVFVLGPGTYSITGSLLASVLFDDNVTPLDATVGGINLSVVPVPDAPALPTLLAGLGVLGLVASRRRVR